MLITSAFDSGNIQVLDISNSSDIRLNIRKDTDSDFYQWFYFRLSGARNEDVGFSIENAGGAAYPEGWENYSVCASYDRTEWFRIPTQYDGQTLKWHCDVDEDHIYFAYFAPYTMEQHADLIADSAQHPLVTTHVLGQTLDEQALDMLEIGYGPEDRKIVWLMARQHPGETMAEWWMEGMLERLLDESDPVSRRLLEKVHFYIVPNMNPDGSKRGHLRTNAAGANLNREWLEPSLERSPEVYLVREKMAETGVDFCMDVHGDEALPYNFLAGFEGIPDIQEEKIALFRKYRGLLATISPDFQEKHGYPISAPGTANLTVGTNYHAHAFNCVAMTLEMPFKDNDDLPDVDHGWSPDRCVHLGRQCLDALYQIVDEL
ncbi:M14-type cytosolic carboxypeptidase [Temperatibacter marinus]|uniref:M14-type cytosolic carboxypeptidase n=1 Tax=Temperatibacter marinus TaxID=1456591 RepID=A0AA52EBU4_9PROT|nr:M14-type cytosolic carboxypeptidase [Temperatibacter marinus]WND01845.1 M14-type cytosolic carboxypeptidase [Temperatibacter marinus]